MDTHPDILVGDVMFRSFRSQLSQNSVTIEILHQVIPSFHQSINVIPRQTIFSGQETFSDCEY